MIKRLSDFLLCLFLSICIVLSFTAEVFALPISSVAPPLIAKTTVREHHSSIQHHLQRNRRILEHQSVPLANVLTGPKMHQELLKDRNRQKIQNYYTLMHSNNCLRLRLKFIKK